MDTNAVFNPVFQPEPALDPWSWFFGFLKANFLSNPVFWGSILLVFIFMYVLRVTIFDNKGVSWNSKSWFYPVCMLLVISFVVWLKNEAPFMLSKKYIADWLTTAAGVAILYMAFGHKLIAKLSEITPWLKEAEPEKKPNPPVNL